MNRIIAGVLIAALAGSATGASWVTGSFRTPSGDLVRRGHTMIEVLAGAGQPLDRRIISRGISIGGVAGLNREQWTYRGSDGIYVITFAGHHVEQIEVVANR